MALVDPEAARHLITENSTMVEIAERETKLALEAARALESAFDWDEHPIEAEGSCWCKLQDLLFKIAGTTFEAEQDRLAADWPLAA